MPNKILTVPDNVLYLARSALHLAASLKQEDLYSALVERGGPHHSPIILIIQQ